MAALCASQPAVSAATDAVAAPTAPRPLEQFFDNTAISDDFATGAADLDGAGNSISAQDLMAAGWHPGQRLTLDGAGHEWPRYGDGAPDNVRTDGQTVKLQGRGNAVSFLVAASTEGAAGSAATGTGTIHYRDGSTGSYTLTAPDWRSGPHATKAVGLPHLNTPGGQLAEKTRLYAVTVPVRRGAMIDAVTLPADPGPTTDLHVFAASVRPEADGWTGSWGAAASGYPAVGPWTDRTLRLVVHTSAGGTAARIRLANTFAAAPVTVGGATVALRADGASAATVPQPVTFDGGRPSAVMPAGAQAVSDPVGFDVPAGADLLVSFHLPGTVVSAPVHSLALQTSYVSAPGSGDRSGDQGGENFTGQIRTWPFLTGVDVSGGPGSVVTLGDSITDGTATTPDTNRRWPDVLARRLRERPGAPVYGVLNQGISANRVASDRYQGDGVSTDLGGVSAQNRLERDVLSQTGVRTVLVFEGVNDVRWGYSAADVIDGLRRIAERAHSRGLRVVAATILPCAGERMCTAEADAQREAVNAFIRDNGGVFDAVADFDAVARDPQRPQALLPAYDSGDHLHPNETGLTALAESVDLGTLVP
ncbi:SGNH/GDSL hydrolase family protein [Streptomyces sp. NPDC051940]|uniref:SGNH/GDSL hydrolase family protein n=1 Tax=Streptomyces sp. NPDC051940 TaxID=3155675 RepID=UPI003436263F